MKKSVVIGKKYIVLTVLVLALAVAVYLNWQLSSENETVSGSDTNQEYLGAAQLVGKQTSSKTSSASDTYFSDARAEREDARDAETDALNEIIADLKASDEAKSEAEKSLVRLAEAIEQEANIETLILAKGFEDCIAVVNGENASIIIRSDGLLGSETVQIQDIVISQTPISLENIKILEVN